jgi:hypothetical protein
MRFMIIVKGNAQTEAGELPTEQQLANMTAYNEELLRAGVFLAGEGLKDSSSGMRVTIKDGEQTFTDGPFAEAKELIAGFTLIEVASREEAVEWVKKWPHAPEDGDFELEIRQVMEADDLGEAFTPELREREDAMRREAERNAAQG